LPKERLAGTKRLGADAGNRNEAIVETDYVDLASFQKTYQALQADAEAMKVYRGMAGIIVQGSSRSEMIERVTKPLA